jgi:hypothetical protein
MSGSGVDSDDVVGVYCKGALQESVIWFVPDDAQLGERIADTAAFDDFSNEIWIVAEHIAVFLENRRTRPSLDQSGSDKLKNERGDVVSRRESSQFQDAGIKNDSQDKAWRDATSARVASIPRMRPLLARSWSCCGLLGALERAPARV